MFFFKWHRHLIPFRSHFLLDRYYNTEYRPPRAREQRMPRLRIVQCFPRHLCTQGLQLLGRFAPLGNLSRVHLHGQVGFPGVGHVLPGKVQNLYLTLCRTCGFCQHNNRHACTVCRGPCGVIFRLLIVSVDCSRPKSKQQYE